ncbi:MAG TPA: hypothetical protein VHC63_16835 [Acidimicrobiales bacterium]|nr:hypothetical protein [Acidimicrobiales bacterium]
MSRRQAGAASLGAALIGLVLFATAPARAATPSVSVAPAAAAPGQKVIVSLKGWPKQQSVVITICGNDAHRGSVDCAVTRSLGYGISQFQQSASVPFEVAAPPAPCPCVIEVTNSTQSLVAFASIEVIGHPVAPIVNAADEPPLSVELSVRRAGAGFGAWVRSQLGGATTYALTVRVHNLVPEALSDIKLTARAGRRGNDQARYVRINGPSTLAAGATWTHTQRVRVPAPVIGKLHWTVAASGAGPITSVSATTSNHALLFVVLLIALLADASWFAQRVIRKRYRRRDESESEPEVVQAPLSYAESILAQPIAPAEPGPEATP